MVAQTNPKPFWTLPPEQEDLAILMTQTKAEKIIGLDISAGMLEVGKQKIQDKTCPTP